MSLITIHWLLGDDVVKEEGFGQQRACEHCPLVLSSDALGAASYGRLIPWVNQERGDPPQSSEASW